jgi:flagellar assembly protein FliH
MNSSPRTVLRGASAAQAVTFTPDALADLPVAVAAEAEPDSAEVVRVDAFAVTAPTDQPSTPVVSPVGETVRSSTRVHFDEVYAEQMAAMREEARREGFEAGHAEGMAAAEQAIAEMVAVAEQRAQAEQDAWRSQAHTSLAALAAAVEAFDSRTAPALEEMTDSLAGAAYTLVGDLFARELAVATEPGRDAVTRALTLVPADQPAVVRLHPDDHACLDPTWVAGLRETITLVPDATVEQAGAVAESGARRVDAQLSTALDRVREVLAR